MNKLNNPALPAEVRSFARFFSTLKYLSERYFGYLFLGVLVWAQWHQAKIKSAALITLYYTEATEESLTSIETNQRGYLYTGDVDLYTDYVKAKAKYLVASRHLEQVLDTDPDDLKRLQNIEGVIQSKIDEMDHTIALYRAGKEDDARRLVLTRQGQRYMTVIREVLAEIRTTKEIKAISAMNSVTGVSD